MPVNVKTVFKVGIIVCRLDRGEKKLKGIFKQLKIAWEKPLKIPALVKNRKNEGNGQERKIPKSFLSETVPGKNISKFELGGQPSQAFV